MYSDILMRDNVVARFVLLSIVIVTLPTKCYLMQSLCVMRMEHT